MIHLRFREIQASVVISHCIENSMVEMIHHGLDHKLYGLDDKYLGLN